MVAVSQVADDFGGVDATEHEGPWGSGLTIHQECSKIAREAGNEVFKQGRCMCAAANYSIAIDLNPQDPANYTNRAAAMLKFSANCDGWLTTTRTVCLPSIPLN